MISSIQRGDYVLEPLVLGDRPQWEVGAAGDAFFEQVPQRVARKERRQ